MSWELVFLPEAEKDLRKLSGNERLVVAKALKKILSNPLPTTEGGYGKPLGNMQGNDLSGFLKVKIKSLGIRIVYKLILAEEKIIVVVIGARADGEVYSSAQKRVETNSL